MEEIQKRAYAKINLSLDVLGKRPDGYHDLRMVMQTVGIFDVITCKKRDDGRVTFETDSRELAAEDAKDNLCVRAAGLLMESCGAGGVHIRLEKRIPIAAGLAGGSTDAAAVMKCVNELYGLGLSGAELEGLGAQLGADVPYTVRGGTVLCEGIGDVMTDLPPLPKCTVVLAVPDIHVSTGEVYGALVLDDDTLHPDTQGQAAAIRAGDLGAAAEKCGNLLARVTEQAHPVIPMLRGAMLGAGALNAVMSGSGPSVFGLFDDEGAARRAFDTIKKHNLARDIFITGLIERWKD